ncbi:MAG: type VI secretion system tip protein TssI/VgrG [Morganella sp. (in: enterobacteria)]
MPFFESNRITTISGPAVPSFPDGNSKLKIVKIYGEEELSKIYSYHIELITAKVLSPEDAANINLLTSVGRELTVSIQLEGINIITSESEYSGDNIGRGIREISGVVTTAKLTEQFNTYCLYRFTIEPWLILATKRSDYKIFQNKSVIDIINEVLNSNYSYSHEIRIKKAYPLINYEVQYGETDFDFIQRLMERYGIYWFFEHEDKVHRMIIVDDINIHIPVKSKAYHCLPYERSENRKEREFVSYFEAQERLQSGIWRTDDFDFTKPKADLKSTKSIKYEKESDKLSVYEWPGNYTDPAQGAAYSQTRMEALFAQRNPSYGRGYIRNIVCGTVFELKKHPMHTANDQYLVIRSHIDIEETGEESHYGETRILSDFNTQSVTIAYRPQRVTQPPKTTGPQTAIVTGPPGQEIWTDQYGRIKLKFHWDHSAVCDHNSSCWIRVSYPWAGGNFGGINIPRIGQEVIVDFENGDPNYPIVTGRVYNAGTMPPWGLPMNATQSGMISRSIGGLLSNANALRFEDKAGMEEVWLQAERDMLSEIKNNEVHKVGANRDRSVGGNESTDIQGTRDESVQGDETIKIMSNRSRSVEQNDTLDIGQDQQTTVKGNQKYEVQQDHDRKVGGNDTLNVDGDQKSSFGQNQDIQVKQDLKESVDGDHTEQVGKKYSLTATDKIELTVGSSSLVMESSGKITLNGSDITFSSSGPVKVSASGNIDISASGNIDISSSGAVQVNGNTIDLN